MKHEDVNADECRRKLLKWMAASPALAYTGLPFFSAFQSSRRWAGKGDGLITSPEDAVNVFDFERVAEEMLPAAHWGYMATGTDNDQTIRANRDGFLKWKLRPRRLVDVSTIDMSVEIFGRRWSTPIVICPTGSNAAFHPDGEPAVARAAKAKDHLMALSNVASTSIEEVNAARGEPIWFQLYPRANWDITKAVVTRAEQAGCPAIVLTVDLLGGSNRETVKRFAMKDQRECTVCHSDERNPPNYDGLELPRNDDYPSTLTWDYVRQVQDHTSMKVLIKGIVTAEDARLAVDNGIDGIIVSNHGGRAEASRRSTIECLPEIVAAVGERIPVIIDSGFRRGTDFFTALALGATAVGIGRPYLWGLAAFGQAGVEAVLEILRRELEIVMMQCGTSSIRAITPKHIVAAG